MPGILPMKVIKVGNSSQSRIAQACDRCRSKKIRCDGVRPCCTQCANVGFECKTSDKLSRRAFPRGYTESLEERVRSLEGEVRELKDLLDEKDEKIDMLAKMHSNRRPSHSTNASTPPMSHHRDDSPAPKEDTFRVQASPLLLGSTTSDSYFMGSSSGRAFIDAFRRKIQENGQSCSFNAEAFINVPKDFTNSKSSTTSASTIPPRLFSDRCINVFWQEWAPLFPVLNKPSFLRLYDEYMKDPEGMHDDHKLAQLHLVFGIAALSGELPDNQQIALCERQWRASLNEVIMDNTLETLQCLILAMMYCISKGDYKKVQYYRSVSVGLSHRLGLHQNQKRFSFGALTTETRKKVFWTLYTIDCFSAALLGLPKLIKDKDIDVDFPVDLDDEYVTEKGYLPTLPGESSRLSSALALFRVSRILSKVLEQNYPASASHDLSLQSLAALEADLNDWSDNLPPHLKLTFVQDKPSTEVTGSRSVLLSLAYYYVRTLIHRPAVGSSLGSKASSSVIAIADSSKHMIQIVQLLEERNMSFSFCLNKNEMLTLCGLSLIYQGLDLKQEGKLMKDSQRLVAAVVNYLGRYNAPGASEFRKLASSLMATEDATKPVARRISDHNMAAPTITKPKVSSLHRKPSTHSLTRYSSVTSNSEIDLLHDQESIRRATMSSVQMQSIGKHSNHSQSSLDSSDSSLARREYRSSMSQGPSPPTHPRARTASTSSKPLPNLDYLSLSNTPSASQGHSPVLTRTTTAPTQTPTFTPATSTSTMPTQQKMSAVTPSEWETLLSTLDGGITNIYDAVYGGPAPILGDVAVNSNTLTATSTSNPAASLGSSSTYGGELYAADAWDLTPESWDMSAFSVGDFDSGNVHAPPQSVLSFSEESLSSGDDLAASDFSGNGGGGGLLGNKGLNGLPLAGDNFLLEGLDGNFGL